MKFLAETFTEFISKGLAKLVGSEVKESAGQDAIVGFGIFFFGALLLFRFITYICEVKTKSAYRKELLRQGYIVEKDTVKSSDKVYKIMRTNQHVLSPKYDLVFIQDRTDK